MKAIKGCINKECQSYKKRVHYKDEFEYCPRCSQKLEYVCADCWGKLEQNNKRLCENCQKDHQQKRQQRIRQGKEVAKKVIELAPVVWKHKDKIIDGGKKVVKVIAKK